MERNDYTEWTDERLLLEVKQLEEINKGWQGDERRTQIRKRIGYIVFEQLQRYKSNHPNDISEELSYEPTN